MGHRKKSAPRRGSLGFRPRKRASRLVPRVRSWPEIDLDKPTLLGFLGYKAGMTHTLVIDNRPRSPTEGKEIFIPVTIVETAPIIPLGVRVYGKIPGYGFYTLTEAWVNPPEELEIKRKIPTFKPTENIDGFFKKVEDIVDKISRISLIVASQPKLVGGLEKKKPDLVEIAVGGGKIEDRLDYARKVLGNEVRVSDVFKEGMYIDVIAVTKGKGFQGVIKRFGVKELPRWHKHRKGSRRIGARSPGRGTFSEVPQAGQMGFHRRTQHNLMILSIGGDGEKITPAGGFPHYGIVRSDYIMLSGSVQGPPKRPVILRYPVRPPGTLLREVPKIVYVSLSSKI